MNKVISVIIIILISALFVCCSSSSEIVNNNISTEPGAEVSILMNDGSEYGGELLYVNDTTMTLCEEYEVDENDLANLVYPIFSIKNRDIKLIELRGENNVQLGMILGVGSGSLIGILIGKASGKNSFEISLGSIGGCLGGGLLGGVIGAVIGSIGSTEDEVVYEYTDPETFDFTELNIYSRYGGKEPEYLMEIK